LANILETDLLARARRPVDRSDRLCLRRTQTPQQRAELCRFDREYFDGQSGYGGYHYDGRHEPAVRHMIDFFALNRDSSLLDVGCAKGFMLYEFFKLGITDVRGCDISAYALANAKPEIRDRLDRLSADHLTYPDRSFDLVYSIDTIHNLAPDACDQAIREIVRVSRRHTFIQVASYEGAEQEHGLREWGITVQTFRSKPQWRDAFRALGYTGHYYFKMF